MLNKDIYYEVISILENITPLNIDIKMEEIVEHSAFKNNKIHLQLIKEYLNDDEIYKQKVERFLYIKTHESNNYQEYIVLDPLFIFVSLEFFIFDEILNDSEKKEMVLNYLNTLNLEQDVHNGQDYFAEAQELLSNYRLIYHYQLLELGTDNLENLKTINQVVDLLSEQKNMIESLDKSLLLSLEKPINFYKEKKEYFKDAYFIEMELNKAQVEEANNIANERLKELEDIWLATAKISIKNLLEIGVKNHIWDKNQNIISQRGQLYGSGKSLLGSLSIALKNFAIPETVNYKIVGNAFCKAFNIKLDENSKEPFKAFSSGNSKIIKHFKRLYKI